MVTGPGVAYSAAVPPPTRASWPRLFPAALFTAVALFIAIASALAIVPLGSKGRVSDMGPDGNINFGPSSFSRTGVAYNSAANEYLAVWASDDTAVDNDVEVWGRRLDASGTPIGSKFQISNMGPAGDATYGAAPFDRVSVAYNSQANEYLVVWSADDDLAPLANGEYEIYAQRVDASGVQQLPDDQRISDMGADGNALIDASDPQVAYDAVANQYVVVWQGDDATDGAFEIYAQLVNPGGMPIGTNDKRVSDMGPEANIAFDAFDPTVAASASGEYLVAWQGDDDTAPLVDNEFEIFAQRLNASLVEQGTNDQRISGMGPDGLTTFVAREPAVAYNPTANQYLVAWQGDDNTAPLVDNEFEIFAQRLTAAGAETGTDDARISDMGTNGSTTATVRAPSAAFSAKADEYLVTWFGDDGRPPLADNEFEVFFQRLSPAGAEVSADTRVSEMGPDGNANFGASGPALARSTQAAEYLATWIGDDAAGLLGNDEFEVYARRIGPPPPPPPPPPGAPPSVALAGASLKGTFSGRTLKGTLKIAGAASASSSVAIRLTRKGRTAALFSTASTVPAGAFTLSLRVSSRRILPGAHTLTVTPAGGSPVSAAVVIAPPRNGIVGSATASSIRGGPAATRIPGGARTVFFRFRFLALPKKGVAIAVRNFKDGKPLGRKPVGKRRAAVIDSFVRSGNGSLPSGRWKAVLYVGGRAVAATSVRLG